MAYSYSSRRIDVSAARLSAKLRNRLDRIADALQERPGCSTPQTFQNWSATKGAYRFYAHPDTTVANLLPALVLPAVRLAYSLPEVLVPHDSTSFNYTHLSKATGLGFLNDSKTARGIHLHSSLLLDPFGGLLGIGHLHFWVRPQFRQESDDKVRHLPIEEKESFKWLLGVRATLQVFQAIGSRLPRFIHVMDREGDVHEVFAEIRKLGHEAVIRCAQNRRVTPEQPEAFDRTDYAKNQCGPAAFAGQVGSAGAAGERRIPHRRGRSPLGPGAFDPRREDASRPQDPEAGAHRGSGDLDTPFGREGGALVVVDDVAGADREASPESP